MSTWFAPVHELRRTLFIIGYWLFFVHDVRSVDQVMAGRKTEMYSSSPAESAQERSGYSSPEDEFNSVRNLEDDESHSRVSRADLRAPEFLIDAREGRGVFVVSGVNHRTELMKTIDKVRAEHGILDPELDDIYGEEFEIAERIHRDRRAFDEIVSHDDAD